MTTEQIDHSDWNNEREKWHAWYIYLSEDETIKKYIPDFEAFETDLNKEPFSKTDTK